MKTKILLSFLLSFSFYLLSSQIPQGFNYQAIARDSKGNPITNATIKVKLSILTDTTGFFLNGTGTYLWEEEQADVKTNAFGLITVVFGNPLATKIQGSATTFSAINWSVSPLYIGTKIANPTSYMNLGSAKLWSVPYSLNSAKADLSTNSSNAATVTNGVYTTGSYSNPAWITSLAGSKITGSVASSTNANTVNNGVYTTGSYSDPAWITSLAGTKISGTVANAKNAIIADTAKVIRNGSKVSVVSGNDDSSEPLFEVKRKDGQTVFAVYPDAVNVFVPRTAKGVKGGFAIGGFDGTKMSPQDYFRVTPDSVRIYIDKTPNILKGTTKGGFAIGGFDQTKGTTGNQDLLTVSNDSIRMYINDASSKGTTKGGFAIGGFSNAKNPTNDYLTVSKDSVRVYIDKTPSSKGTKGGFAIGGFDNVKAAKEEYLRVTRDSTRITSSDPIKGFVVGNLSTGVTENYLQLSPNNYFIGHETGHSNTTGLYNSFIGYKAGRSNTTGNYNIFIGDHSGYLNDEGMFNLFIGDSAGYQNTSGFSNVFLGPWAGMSNSTGYYNVSLGYIAGAYNETGWQNIFLGTGAGMSTSAGNRNIYLGVNSGMNNREGALNVLIGNFAGYTSQGSNNVYIGSYAGRLDTLGSNNVFIGYEAGRSEKSSNRLIIANSRTSTPLIYGEFDNNLLHINGRMEITDNLNVNGEINVNNNKITNVGNPVNSSDAATKAYVDLLQNQINILKNTLSAGGMVVDIDGNSYNTVKIGTQFWMEENLKTTRYNNGDLIGTTTPATLDITAEVAPMYSWSYAGNESNAANYGRLYTWHAITDSRKVCPSGWHVPSDAEWTTLTTYLGGEGIAGGKLKETGTTHWPGSNIATNESGFSALPGGSRPSNGSFSGAGTIGVWWSSTEYSADQAWYRAMDNNIATGRYRSTERGGISVRCMKD